MLLELSELLACPRCGPPQPLIVLVDELQGRRVRQGRLGCAACDARFPIRHGVLHLGESRSAPSVPGDAAQLALETAALLDAGSTRGALLLDESLAAVAREVAGLAQGAVVIALGVAPHGPGAAEREGPEPSRIVGAAESPLPFRTGRLAGAAFREAGAPRLREAGRVLAPGGRLVLLRPEPGVRRALDGLPFEILAAEERAVVARRR